MPRPHRSPPARPRRTRPTVVGLAAALAVGVPVAPAAAQAGAPAGAPAADPAGPAPTAVAHDCGDGFRFVADVWPDSVRLTLPGDRRLALPAARAASGARYAAGADVYWSRGRTARLVADGRVRADCRALPAVEVPWERARAEGVDFRGVGQEPGWLLDVRDGERVTWLGDYGRTRVETPAPAPTGPPARRRYAIRTEAHRLDLRLETVPGRPCRDAMSGRPFPTTVTVTLDGRTHRGCGRALAPRDGSGRVRKG